ncbi:N-acetylmuramoyl-L-alanine amidase family protein [Spirochaeta dissipatitropha]
MNSCRLKILFLITFILIQTFTVFADTALEEILDQLQVQLQWDPVSSRGTLVRNNNYFTFFPGVPFGLYNFQESIPMEAIYWTGSGALYVPETTVKLITDMFPEANILNERRIATIFIDPGHGGKDPGAIGRHVIDGKPLVLQEKDVVLDVSLRLRDLLVRRYPDINIVMSREDDRYIELIDRYEMANSLHSSQNEAIIFVSIHANASINTRAQGFEVWYLPPEFRRTLITQNDFDGTEEIIPILNSMLEEEYTIQSIFLGQHILEGMEYQLGNQVPNRGLKQETFAVVRGARMPSVLVEVGFLTNANEFMLLRDPGHLQELSEGIYTGIRNFIESFEN